MPTDEAVSADTVAAIAGVVGGMAGVASLVWTVIYALTLRPRVRWSLHRFDDRTIPTFVAPGTVMTYPPLDPDPPSTLQFFFRNTGALAADEAHAIISGGSWHKPIEFPANGRLRVEPGGEIAVKVPAKSIDGMLANRPYAHGDDIVFDLRGVVVEVKWRRQTWGFAKRRFYLWRDQTKVPFVPPDGGIA